MIYHCFFLLKKYCCSLNLKCYPDSAPSKATFERWFGKIKLNRTDTNEAERPGRPNRVVALENINIIWGDRKM